MPQCTKIVRKVPRRVVWEKAANCVEPFIRELIRDTIFSKYRLQMPIKVEQLRNELQNQLIRDDIDFSPSVAQFNRILKGIGFRYAKIKDRSIIFERADLSKARAEYLRQEA